MPSFESVSLAAAELGFRRELGALAEHIPTLGEMARRPPSELMARARFSPEPWQADALDSPDDYIALLSARQAGKTTVFSVGAVHDMLEPRSLMVLVAPVLAQSMEIYERIGDILENAGLFGTLVNPRDHRKRSTLARNGSRIVVVSGHKPINARGRAKVKRVYADESAFMHDQLIPTFMPMLGRCDGRIMMGGTAFGARGYFWEVMTNQDHRHDDWRRIVVTGEDDGEATTARFPGARTSYSQALSTKLTKHGEPFLEAERRRMGDWWYMQEYGCVFHDPIGALFTTEHIELARSSTILPLWPDSQWVKQSGVSSGNGGNGNGNGNGSSKSVSSLW